MSDSNRLFITIAKAVNEERYEDASILLRRYNETVQKNNKHLNDDRTTTPQRNTMSKSLER